MDDEAIAEGDRLRIQGKWYTVDAIDPTKNGFRSLRLVPAVAGDAVVRLERRMDGIYVIKVWEVDEAEIHHQEVHDAD